MKRIYAILAAAGWLWLFIAMAVLWVKLRKRSGGRGFEVVDKHER